MQILKKHIYLSVITCSTILFLTACGNKSADKKEGDTHDHEEAPNTVELTAAQFKTAGITYGKPENRQISGAVKVNGFLDVPPQQLVSISVPMGGFIKQTTLLQGMPVKKGQVIAVLENLDYIQLQQDYLDIKSQLEYATVEYKRQQELAVENVNALKTLQQAKAAYQSLQAKESGMKQKLALLNINMPALEKGNIQRTINVYAPISGYVTQVNVNLGQFVNPADILFRIVNTEHLHAELTVFEKDIPRLKIGQLVRFTLANETAQRTATVHLIGREISPERTVRVHCHLDAEDTQLLPGTYLQAMIETGAANVPALPDAALVNFENKAYVFMKAPGNANDSTYHFTMLEVKKGNNEQGYTEVTFPAKTPDQEIVVKGAYDLLAKMKNSGEEEGH
ncbi:efflux RND transporter periplasmic adaptor subunit [Chitinophaga nivalis]|uniref:Efflux RND transporter periplasmic adaptor subunit n=1 Tax=Chitinophaga nivalis TaxID=2991709 RepID=A0ABT3ILM9_9BACT|nr:efflux RND transporter periplasmic adaptor subunit [Chitinophaga nivalis]MCW3465634.1 efflux RND transporter periplasmic adaptor subunit [Chitinophaga nivalis]MCW3484675.1 efflux RND transporter periplasmic adaptor subunit [Chitinophaga nivalis]